MDHTSVTQITIHTFTMDNGIWDRF
uniref:Uncharacterized protein n=1 Tax=Anguilla anguilla TaxID=7936 RepID=A0A0E9PG14_ANGAN